MKNRIVASKPGEYEQKEVSKAFRKAAIDRIKRLEWKKHVLVNTKNIVECLHCGQPGHKWWCPLVIFARLARGLEADIPSDSQIRRVVKSMMRDAMWNSCHYYHDEIESSLGASRMLFHICIYCGCEAYDHAVDCPLSIMEKRVTTGLRESEEKSKSRVEHKQTKLEYAAKKETQRARIKKYLMRFTTYKLVQTISTEVGIRKASVRRVLGELKREGKVISIKAGRWHTAWKWGRE